MPTQPNEQSNVFPVIPLTQTSNMQSTQEYKLTQYSSATIPTITREPSPRSLEDDILSQEWCEEDMLVSPSTHEKSSDFSFVEQPGSYARTASSVKQVEESFIMIEDTIEDSTSHEETSPMDERSKAKRAEPQVQPTAIEVLNKYPHIVLKLCDGESGERIANLSQFLAANNLNEPARSDSDPRSPLSPTLLINNEYVALTNENFADTSLPPSQDITSNPSPSQTLAQLNQSLIDHDEMVILVINEAMSQDLQLDQSQSQQQSSQIMLGHEETVIAMSQTLPEIQPNTMAPINASTILEVNNLELQVTEDIGDLLAGFPEGWWEGETRMHYHTNEARWGPEGVPENEIERIVRNRPSKIPTNADCITYLYDYIELDDRGSKIEDHKSQC